MKGDPASTRAARLVLRLAGWLAPSEAQPGSSEEWNAELWEMTRRGGRGQIAFALGALRHALFLRRREWTLDLLASDIRFAVRGLVRSPMFALVSVITLALGIGANTTIFSLLNGLMLRAPRAISEPERLVQIGRGADPAGFDAWSFPYFLDLREHTTQTFDGMAAWAEAYVVTGAGAAGRSASAHVVSGNYFGVLGVLPQLGRLLEPEDDAAPGVRPVVVVSDAFWRLELSADPSIVGHEITINARTFEVVGVAPEGFAGTDVFRAPASMWVPLSMQNVLTQRPVEAVEHRGNSWLWVLARLRPNVSVEAARTEVVAARAAIDAAQPEFAAGGALVEAGVGLRPVERANAARLGGLLLAVVGAVLLIACANLTGLALARGTARRGEIGVRAVLGARRSRLVRQLLIESLLVAAAGALMATTLALALSSFLPRLIPIPVAVDFRPDLGVFGFTALVALAAGIAFGLVPALHASRADLTSTLRTGGIGRGASASGLALRRVLVVGQLGLSFVLLAGATLLVRSVRNAYLADPGFRMRGVHVVSLDLARSGDFDATTRGALRGALVARIAALPGVEAVGASMVLPIADHQPNRTPLPPGTRPTLDGPRPQPVYTNTVDGGYFAALGLRPVSGRVFEDRDHENSSQVVIVNEQFAERFFPDGGALDATLPFAWSPDGTPRIIGIVSDAAIRSLGETPPAAVYSPFTPASSTAFDLVIATRADMAATRRAVVDAIAAVDPRLPILRFAELDQLVGGSLAQTRLTAGVVGGAGALALVLAAVGLYGVIAYAVAQRTREFGIRLALGARQLSLLTMVLRQGATLAVMGITLGALTSLVALRAIERLLFGVTPFDAPTLFGIAAGLAIVTLLATGIPALRATRTDPARTLAD